MTDKHIAWIAGAVLVASILLVGHLNARDIKTCQQAGNSLETCYATFNP